MGTFQIVGKAQANDPNKVDPRVLDIIQRTAAASPYNVVVFSGYRPGDKRQHGIGAATDIYLVDPKTGIAVPNLKSAYGFQTMEQFAQQARAVQMQVYPDMKDSFRWGGYFSGATNYGAVDLMHFDNNTKVGMAGGSWEGGLTDAQARKVARMGYGQIYTEQGQFDYATYRLGGEEEVKKFQEANGLEVDGIVGPNTTRALMQTGYIDQLPGQPQPPTAIARSPPNPDDAKMAGVMLAEARGEGYEGMLGVANVIHNRQLDQTPKWERWGDTVDSVLGGKEFAPPLTQDQVSPELWSLATNIAAGVRQGFLKDNTNGATFFYNPNSADPDQVAVINADTGGLNQKQIGGHVYVGQGTYVDPAKAAETQVASGITDPGRVDTSTLAFAELPAETPAAAVPAALTTPSAPAAPPPATPAAPPADAYTPAAAFAPITEARTKDETTYPATPRESVVQSVAGPAFAPVPTTPSDSPFPESSRDVYASKYGTEKRETDAALAALKEPTDWAVGRDKYAPMLPSSSVEPYKTLWDREGNPGAPTKPESAAFAPIAGRDPLTGASYGMGEAYGPGAVAVPASVASKVVPEQIYEDQYGVGGFTYFDPWQAPPEPGEATSFTTPENVATPEAETAETPAVPTPAAAKTGTTTVETKAGNKNSLFGTLFGAGGVFSKGGAIDNVIKPGDLARSLAGIGGPQVFNAGGPSGKTPNGWNYQTGTGFQGQPATQFTSGGRTYTYNDTTAFGGAGIGGWSK